jgi:hypothetical protein
MAQGEPLSRGRLGRDLIREARRLNQHISHLAVKDTRTLQGIIKELERIHDDDEECVNLARRHGDRPPPWGTKYASAIERAISTVFQRR